jgi:hypothetical protein
MKEQIYTLLALVIIIVCSFFVGYIHALPNNPQINSFDGNWTRENQKIDGYFHLMCDKFWEIREYINNTYNCLNISKDFYTLSRLNGYEVGIISIFPINESQIGHTLNYYTDMNGDTTYIEAQGCSYYYSLQEIFIENYDEIYDGSKHKVIYWELK